MTDFLPHQPILIIAGMHRSGTSLIASLLQSSGLYIGENLLEADPGNSKGYFENIDFLEFHQKLLISLGVEDGCWPLEEILYISEDYASEAKRLVEKNASLTQPWGWKEPRTTLFLSFWQQIIPEAKFVFVYRSPWEVIDSLYRRGDDIFQANPALALSMWMLYNSKLLDFYSGHSDRCLLASTSAIVQNPVKFVEMVNHKLNLHLGVPDSLIYEDSLLRKEEMNSYHQTFIQKFFPDVFQLFARLNLYADLSQTVTDAIDFSSDSLLKDWARASQLAVVRKQVAELTEHKVWFAQQLENSQKQVAELTEHKVWFAQQLEDSQKQVAELTEHKVWFAQQLENSQKQVAELTEHKVWFAQQLENSQQEILKYKSGFEEVKLDSLNLRTNYSQIHLDCDRLKAKLSEKRSKLVEARIRLKKKNMMLREIRKELEQLREVIQAMESSKFWKLRNFWFKLRRNFRRG